VAWHRPIVLVHLPVAPLPVEVLARAQAEPADHPPGRQLGLGAPGGDEVDHGVSRVVGNPPAAQSSPSSFFVFTNSSVTFAMTRSFCVSRSRSSSTFRSSARCSVLVSFAKAAAPFSKNCFCQV